MVETVEAGARVLSHWNAVLGEVKKISAFSGRFKDQSMRYVHMNITSPPSDEHAQSHWQVRYIN